MRSDLCCDPEAMFATGEGVKPLPRHTMPIADVAQVLGVSTNRVRQLDDELEPIRVGRFRRYEPRRVEAVAKARERQTGTAR